MHDFGNRERITADREIWTDRIALRFGIESARGLAVAQPVVMVEQDKAATVLPFIELPTETAQALMDELWRCGLRPTEGSGSAGAMAATTRHLEDMRRLVFSEGKEAK